jgi:CSLREA domain-containing protein
MHKLSSIFAVLVAALCSHAAFGAVLTVTNTNDSGAGSLRDTIAAASAGDEIQFATPLLGKTITVTSGQIEIAKNLTITGLGAANLTLTTNNTGRIFYIHSGANVAISGLTIKNSHAFDNGGGILIELATVSVTGCVFSGNSAVNNGGAIFSNGSGSGNSASLTVAACAFTGNGSGDGAGAIVSDGSSGGNATLTINNSTFTGNSSATAGAIWSYGNGGTVVMTVTGSTFTSNSAGGGGGAIYSSGQSNGSATLTIFKSTFGGNSTAGSSAGIANDASFGGSATLKLSTSTFSGNLSGVGSDIYSIGQGSGNAIAQVAGCTFAGSVGGSIVNDSDGQGSGGAGSATLEIGNCIIATQSGASLANSNGTITSRGYNLSSDAGGGFLTASGDQTSTDPKLDPNGLQNNGGPTQTIALLPGSPAVDKGKANTIPALVSATDQRGFTRTGDNSNIPNAQGGDGTDIGAFEGRLFVVNTTADGFDGDPTNATTTLREALIFASVAPDVDVLRVNITQPNNKFKKFIGGQTITLDSTLGELAIDGSLIIDGPGASLLTISGGGKVRVFNIGSVNADIDVTISGVTIDGGFARGADNAFNPLPFASAGGLGSGGGIYNASSGTVNVTNCVLSNNAARGGDGSNFLAAGGDGRGGGIAHAGAGILNVMGSTFVQNTATGGDGDGVNFSAGGAGVGGAISNESSGTVNVLNSTFAANSAAVGSGGTPVNSATGGGIANGRNTSSTDSVGSSSGTLNVASSTFSGNSAITGGAIFNDGTMQIGNNIFNAGASGANLASGASGPTSTVRYNLSTTVSAGYNLSNDDGGGFLTGTADQTSTDPKLDTNGLQDNGGPTPTIALQAGSPAIDKGKRDTIAALATNIDQRGVTRPDDDPNIANADGGDGSDIGAFEKVNNRPPTISSPTTVTVAFAGYSTQVTIDVDVDDADGDELTVSWDYDNQTADVPAAKPDPTSATVPFAAGFPVGDTLVTFSVSDGKAPDVTSQTTVTVLPPRDVKSAAVVVLQGLLPTGNRKTDAALQMAIADINASLNGSLWRDAVHLTANGPQVFNKEKDAATALAQVVKAGGKLGGAARQQIALLVAVDKGLAQVAIDDATAANGNPSELAKARTEMAKGQAALKSGNFTDAVNHFQQAWLHAQAAMTTKKR